MVNNRRVNGLHKREFMEVWAQGQRGCQASAGRRQAPYVVRLPEHGPRKGDHDMAAGLGLDHELRRLGRSHGTRPTVARRILMFDNRHARAHAASQRSQPGSQAGRAGMPNIGVLST